MTKKQVWTAVFGVAAIAVVWGIYALVHPKGVPPASTSEQSLAAWLQKNHFTPVDPYADDVGPGTVVILEPAGMTLAMRAGDLKGIAALPPGATQDWTFGYDRSDQNNLNVNPLPEDLTNAIQQSAGTKAKIVVQGLSIERYSLLELKQAILSTPELTLLAASNPDVVVVNEAAHVSGLQVTVEDAKGGNVTSNVFKRLSGGSGYKLNSDSTLVVDKPVFIGLKLLKLNAALNWDAGSGGGATTAGTGTGTASTTTGTGSTGSTGGIPARRVINFKASVDLIPGSSVTKPVTDKGYDRVGDKVVLGQGSKQREAMVGVLKSDGTYKVVAPLNKALNVQFQEVPMVAHLKLLGTKK